MILRYEEPEFEFHSSYNSLLLSFVFTSPQPSIGYGEPFSMDESHLTELFGFNNICTYWDYSPSREIIAMYFPFFEYSLVMYIVIDFVNTMLSYRNGELPRWYWILMKIVTPFNILFCVMFRMIFVFIAYENPRYHTLAFLGLQMALIIVAFFNVWYILLTRQEWTKPCKLGRLGLARMAVVYLSLNVAISAVKIYATIYIVANKDVVSPRFYKIPVGGVVLGQIIDWIWMLFNGVLPLIISALRMVNEDPFTVTFSQPKHHWYSEDDTASMLTPYVFEGITKLTPIKGSETKNENLAKIFRDEGHKRAQINLWDGSWIPEFYLPSAYGIEDGSRLEFDCQTSYSTKIHYPEGNWTKNLSTGESLILVVKKSRWVIEEKGNKEKPHSENDNEEPEDEEPEPYSDDSRPGNPLDYY